MWICYANDCKWTFWLKECRTTVGYSCRFNDSTGSRPLYQAKSRIYVIGKLCDNGIIQSKNKKHVHLLLVTYLSEFLSLFSEKS